MNRRDAMDAEFCAVRLFFACIASLRLNGFSENLRRMKRCWEIALQRRKGTENPADSVGCQPLMGAHGRPPHYGFHCLAFASWLLSAFALNSNGLIPAQA